VRRRVHRTAPRSLEDRLRVVPVETSRLVTLEDPEASPEEARGAFARIRPPAGTSSNAVTEWRERVDRVAQAVRVMAAPKAADVPLASTRVDAVVKLGSFREEAIRLAKETNDPEIEAFVLRKLDEVGA